jgi:hypothetical protein
MGPAGIVRSRGVTGRSIARETVGTFAGPAGLFRQRTEITKPQRDILTALHLDLPPRIYQLTPADT